MRLTIHIKKRVLMTLIYNLFILGCFAQTATLKGTVRHENHTIAFARVQLKELTIGAIASNSGAFVLYNIPAGTYQLEVSATGYEKKQVTVQLNENETKEISIDLIASAASLNEIVVSGTLKEVSKLDSPVPVEVYTAKFFKSNPTPNIFDALQNVNGVRPQLNCNVCNTGDIHINGLEGPYTMVLIDGMPIVSGLSTVYGLFGIPQSLIERIEIVKGPASTLYGSEAVGGLINVITKKPTNAPNFSADVFGTSWAELNADIAGKFNVGKKAQSFVGLNYYNYSNPIDNNKDNFTDLTIQNRISVFNKWNFERKENRVFSLAGRYIQEERWGGDMNWTKQFRGGDSLYGESIYTKRWEVFGTYQLPVKEKIMLQISANGHDQNSVYGNIPYIAQQYIGFSQLYWNKKLKNNDLLVGTTFRYTYYDDNTPATEIVDTSGGKTSQPSKIHLPGIFVQDEVELNANNKILLGLRYDYNSIHGSIVTPRINYKWSSKSRNSVVRIGFGNGYRVANVFTEDHTALTGARKLEFLSDLKPETSWNGNVNVVQKIFSKNGTYIGLDAAAFYTYFTNKIIADYDTDPNKIIYNNLNGFAVSQGVSMNLDIKLKNGIKLLAGGTFMDVTSTENEVKKRQLFTERFSGVWNLEYTIKSINLTVDYTGNVYSPMRLPLLGEEDPRSEYSPWWSIQNIQMTKKFKKGIELYGGVKNLLNWTPNKGNPFIIARTNDPFDKQVQFDSAGKALKTPNNPNGLTFDPTYVYGPNQGIRGFLGVRYTFSKQ